MGIILWAISQNLYTVMQTPAERVFFAIALVIAGSIIYLGIVYILKVFFQKIQKRP